MDGEEESAQQKKQQIRSKAVPKHGPWSIQAVGISLGHSEYLVADCCSISNLCLSSPPESQLHVHLIAVEDTLGGRIHCKAGFLVQMFIVLFLVFKFGLGLNQTEAHSSEISCK